MRSVKQPEDWLFGNSHIVPFTHRRVQPGVSVSKKPSRRIAERKNRIEAAKRMALMRAQWAKTGDPVHAAIVAACGSPVHDNPHGGMT